MPTRILPGILFAAFAVGIWLVVDGSVIAGALMIALIVTLALGLLLTR